MNPLTIKTGHRDKVNLVFFSDVHASAKAPGRRRETYGDEVLGKLLFAAEVTTTVKGAGLCGGDLFHIKNPESRSNTTSYVTSVMGALQHFPTGRVYGCVGNHDLTGDNMTTLPHQPLGNLIQSGAYHDLGYQSVVFEADNGIRVRVDAFDFVSGEETLERIRARGREIRAEIESYEQHQLDWMARPIHHWVAVVHHFNQPGTSGLMFNKDFALGHNDLLFCSYDAYLFGHDHSRKGIIETNGIYFVQLGSLTRAALAEDETDRPVALAILSFGRDGLKIVEKEVPVKPLELAFHTADIAVDKVEKREDIVGFMKDLDAHAAAVDTDNPVEILTALTQDPAIIDTIKDVCEL